MSCKSVSNQLRAIQYVEHPSDRRLGYIGSYTAVVLAQAGHRVVLLDNLSNSRADVAEHIGRITGTTPELEIADVLETARVRLILRHYAIDAVIHFAGLKAVGESVAQPLA